MIPCICGSPQGSLHRRKGVVGARRVGPPGGSLRHRKEFEGADSSSHDAKSSSHSSSVASMPTTRSARRNSERLMVPERSESHFWKRSVRRSGLSHSDDRTLTSAWWRSYSGDCTVVIAQRPARLAHRRRPLGDGVLAAAASVCALHNSTCTPCAPAACGLPFNVNVRAWPRRWVRAAHTHDALGPSSELRDNGTLHTGLAVCAVGRYDEHALRSLCTDPPEPGQVKPSAPTQPSQIKRSQASTRPPLHAPMARPPQEVRRT